MGKHATVLQKALPHPDLDPFAATAAHSAPLPCTLAGRAYSELANRLFTGPTARSVVAFAAVNRGEGVTHIVRGVAAELVRCGKRVAVLDGGLSHLQIPGMAIPEIDAELGPAILGAPLPAEPANEPARLITALRERYDSVLLDCGSLERSVDLLRFTPWTDGVVLIVEAGRTAKEQIDRAAHIIREARGAFLGFVLNKRRYPIPGWLYRIL
jgi:Mrp family chromosome partitioning ATPase